MVEIDVGGFSAGTKGARLEEPEALGDEDSEFEDQADGGEGGRCQWEGLWLRGGLREYLHYDVENAAEGVEGVLYDWEWG